MRDRSPRSRCVAKVAREEDEGDVSGVFCVLQAGKVSEFERGFAVVVENLRGVLAGGLTTGVDEFLRCCQIGKDDRQEKDGTWRNTFPNILSVSSLNCVEKITVTRSAAARM